MKSKKAQMSPFAQELLQSMGEAVDYLKGTGTVRKTQLTLPDPPPKVTYQEIQALRKRFEMTQTQFARLMNVSTKTIESWEQGMRAPSGVALRMIQFIGHPEVLSPLIHLRK